MRDWWNTLDRDKRMLVLSAGGMWIAQILYVLSPIDLVPDLVPVLGWLDDVVAIGATGLFTAWVYRQVSGREGFSDLVPEALRPRSVPEPTLDEPPIPDPHEAAVDGSGDDLGIDGYRPLSNDELKAL